MAEFRLEIAGCVGHITSLFDSTPHYFSKYLTDAPADFSAMVRPEDLVFEQDELDREAREEGFKRRQFTDPFLERAAIQRAFANFLLPRQVLLVHGSAIAADGKGYLFIARSGTGKSTHTRLWQQLLTDRAVMINDDKPFVRFRDDGIFLCGSPWSGKHGLDSNISVPLAGICLLERGSENRIRPLPGDRRLEHLTQHSCPPADASLLPFFAPLVQKLSLSVPMWQMACTKDPAAARMAFAAMTSL